MARAFADTHYWIAICNPHDNWHAAAIEAHRALGPTVLHTTDEVLTEFLGYFSKQGSGLRRRAAEAAAWILRDPNVRVWPQSRDGFEAALALYASREDKRFSLVDCRSMLVMHQQRLAQILTHDRDFERAGFEVLIK